MKFIKPKYFEVEPVTFELSRKTRTIIEQYAEYTGLNESHVLEEFLDNILNDGDFTDYIEKKRSNKRIKRDLGLSDD